MLTTAELEFLSAWAREEREPACYQLPAHRLQLANGVPGISLIALIKAWTGGERKKDHEILAIPASPNPSWPWATARELQDRLREVGKRWVTSDLAHRIARLDAEKAYRDLTPYRVLVELQHDGWHVDYELKNRQSHGGGPHYVIDAQSGEIRAKRYEQ